LKAYYIYVVKKNPQLIKLGEHKRELRKEKGRKRVLLIMSCSWGVERGERNLATLNLLRIAAALNVEVGIIISSY